MSSCIAAKGNTECGRWCPGIVCATCEDRVAGQLREIPDLYAMSEPFLMPGAPAPSDGSRHTKGDSAPLPCNEQVLSLRQQGGVANPLRFWEDSVREWFELTAGTFRGDTEQTIVGTAEFLLAWLPRCCNDFGPMGEYTKVVGRIHKQLMFAVGEVEDRPRSVGTCPELVEQDDAEPLVCGHKLYLDSYGAGEVHCVGVVRHTWPRERWLLLGQIIPDPRKGATA